MQIEAVLWEAKRPMKTVEILEALKQRGIDVPGKVPLNNLAAHLSHHKKYFINTSEGWQRRQTELNDEKTNAQTAG